MAQTYTIEIRDCAFALNKCLLGIYNGSGSGRIVRLYRAWALNNGLTAVSGVLTTLELRRITAGSGGTAITPVKHDTNSESFPGQIVVATNPSYTISDLLRRIIWSNDEPAAGGATLDELECLVPLACIWDLGYGDSTVEPIVCRENYGVALINTGSTAIGIIDVFFEVTLASS